MRTRGAAYSQRREAREKISKRAGLSGAGAVLAIALAAPDSTHAAVFQCPAGNVACLIEAIEIFNGNGEADQLFLEAGVYTLTAVNNETDGPNGLPSISSTITIQGAGAAATIIQRDPALGDEEPFRILHISASGTLVLEGVTISRGFLGFEAGGFPGGAGILNLGDTGINNCIIDRNVNDGGSGGGGIANLGNMIIIGSRVSTNGGSEPNGAGISNSFGLAISQSTISGNFSQAPARGGGIDNSGSASITRSAIAGNGAADGGGIANVGGTLFLASSTVYDNSADGRGGGGVYVSGGTVILNNDTIARNRVDLVAFGGGAGIQNGGVAGDGTGTVQLQNTILAHNTVLGDPHFQPGPDCFGSVTSLGHNLVGDPSDCTIALLASDLTGDPGLDSLQDDATPGNGHFPLLGSSQAVDAGDPASCATTDQLGHFRIDGDNDGTVVCDIGAIEFFPDADGDGVPDFLDPFPDSDLRPTVVIDECDSGVANTLFPDGSTIADLTGQCASEAGNHGAFVSCVSHLTNDLSQDGIITGQEKNDIQTCAAGASIP